MQQPLKLAGRINAPPDRRIEKIAWSAAGDAIAGATRLRAGLQPNTAYPASFADVPLLRNLVIRETGSAVHVWDVASGSVRDVLEGVAPKRGYVHAIDWMARGSVLAAGSSDGSITLWDATSGRLLTRLKGHSAAVIGLAWSPDGRLASVSNDGDARIWNPAIRRSIRLLRGHEDRIPGLAWSPDGQRLATGSGDSTIRIWELLAGREVDRFQARGYVNSVAWSPDGDTIAAVCWGQQSAVKLWDVHDGRVRILEPRDHLTEVEFSPDGRWLATAADGPDAVMNVWETATWERAAELEAMRAAAFSPPGDRLASLARDRAAIELWDVDVERSIDALAAGAGRSPLDGDTVFISHASPDRPEVERAILEPLRQAGIQVWYSAEDIPATAEWERSIRNALRSCAWFLVVVSEQSIRSQWVRTELAWAVKHRRGRIVPVLIESCDATDLNLHLEQLQFVDLRSDAERGGRDLVELLTPLPPAR